MRKIILLSLSTILLAGGMSSCSSSESVVSNSFLQKRKYTKGFHKNSRATLKSTDINQEELVLEVKATKSATANNITPKTVNEHVSSTTELIIATESAPLAENTSTTRSTTKKSTATNTNLADKHNSKPIEILKNTTAKIVSAVSQTDNTTAVSQTLDFNTFLLYVLCFLLPFLAVGIATGWNLGAVLINILLTIFFVIPGIIHAIIVVSRNT